MKQVTLLFFLCLMYFFSCGNKPTENKKKAKNNSISASHESIELKGIYKGKNLYVQNPFSGKNTHCITEIKINGNYPDETASDLTEIFLENRGLKIGDSISILIKHHGNCKPKVLNPEAIGLQH
ncbi:MAG: hypothetical protein IAF38_16105 [Bacteroidia bacterium]|nr:hypothetical protein [Bacteroidia bacterium]